MTAAPTNALAQGESAQGYLADPRNDGVLVYVNGAFVPRDEARVSIFDSGFVLGDGIWEGLRLVNGQKLFDCFQFQDNFVLHDQIELVPAVQLQALVQQG